MAETNDIEIKLKAKNEADSGINSFIRDVDKLGPAAKDASKSFTDSFQGLEKYSKIAALTAAGVRSVELAQSAATLAIGKASDTVEDIASDYTRAKTAAQEFAAGIPLIGNAVKQLQAGVFSLSERIFGDPAAELNKFREAQAALARSSHAAADAAIRETAAYAGLQKILTEQVNRGAIDAFGAQGPGRDRATIMQQQQNELESLARERAAAAAKFTPSGLSETEKQVLARAQEVDRQIREQSSLAADLQRVADGNGSASGRAKMGVITAQQEIERLRQDPDFRQREAINRRMSEGAAKAQADADTAEIKMRENHQRQLRDMDARFDEQRQALRVSAIEDLAAASAQAYIASTNDELEIIKRTAAERNRLIEETGAKAARDALFADPSGEAAYTIGETTKARLEASRAQEQRDLRAAGQRQWDDAAKRGEDQARARSDAKGAIDAMILDIERQTLTTMKEAAARGDKEAQVQARSLEAEIKKAEAQERYTAVLNRATELTAQADPADKEAMAKIARSLDMGKAAYDAALAADTPPADRAATIAAALPSLETDRYLTGVRQYAMERGGTLNPQDDPAKQLEKQTRELVALTKKNNDALWKMAAALDRNKLVAIVAGSPG